jgi:hypothetical protein
MTNRNHWTEEQEEQAKILISRRMGKQEFFEKVGHNKGSARARLRLIGYNKEQRNHWTSEQDNLAASLIAQNASKQEFYEKVGHSKGAAYSRMRAIGRSIIRQRRTRTMERTSTRPTPGMLADAERREQLKLTVWFGDPPPGYSALDRRKE